MSFFDKFRRKKKAIETAPAKIDQTLVDEEKKVSSLKAAKGARVQVEAVKKRPVSRSKTESKEGKPARAQKGDAQEAYRILTRPLLTEKSSDGGISSKYTFEVAPQANKIAIKKALQGLYGVEPIAVNIINQSGKFTRYGRSAGSTKHWKKAIVTLKKGDKIELYEGV